MKAPAQIVDDLLEADDFDPKEFAMNTQVGDGPLLDIIQAAYNRILALPHNGPAFQQFHPEVAKIIKGMVAALEIETGRQALEGTREMLKSFAPMPWNPSRGVVNRKFARDILSMFRANSRKMKLRENLDSMEGVPIAARTDRRSRSERCRSRH